ncbi:hypothetical protein D9M68_758790 [compost metagenome]
MLHLFLVGAVSVEDVAQYEGKCSGCKPLEYARIGGELKYPWKAKALRLRLHSIGSDRKRGHLLGILASSHEMPNDRVDAAESINGCRQRTHVDHMADSVFPFIAKLKGIAAELVCKSILLHIFLDTS